MPHLPNRVLRILAQLRRASRDDESDQVTGTRREPSGSPEQSHRPRSSFRVSRCVAV
ncbi:hypothetical protein C8Q74DRAFT_1293024 [Fomes fomentarius]|nr:hypothetical protein C8Q74DRAFT_1293024 [Fomes fomentarius]